MSALLRAIAGSLGGGPITVSANWGADSGAVPSTITSATRTLTVPGGNPGSLDLAFANITGGTFQYSKNGGAFTTFSNGADVTFANGDTLAFRVTSPSVPGGGGGITVTDNLRGTTVGTWDVTIDP